MSLIRPNKTEYYLSMLELVASRSTCIRRKVGSIITDKEGCVLSTGYNGVPRDFNHCIDIQCAGANDKSGDSSNCMAVHSEQNALLQCLDINRAHTLYCSCVPCFICAKMIANTNIENIVCVSDYPDKRGLRVLLERGCTVTIEGKLIDGENFT